jgi:ribonuclease-3
MEALLAALFLEHGLDAARATILRLWAPHLDRVEHLAPQDAKSALQEWAQARGMPPPAYVTTRRSGPDHAPRFTVEARLENGHAKAATAGSKRAAEQEAAAAMLASLGDE